jgi:uncharacterized protein
MPTDHQSGQADTGAAMVMTPQPRFVADVMLGKLTKWLRVMGIDAHYQATLTDTQLLQCAERDGRILLTRDRYLMRRRGTARRLYIESNYYHEQVRQVVRAFDLLSSFQVFSRCLRCNEPLRNVTKSTVATQVPPYVYATQAAFKQCPRCHQVYWGGTHRDNMLRQLQTMLASLALVQP